MERSRDPRSRDLGIDAARGLAVVSMYVAHLAPSDGPLKVLLLSEFLTAPLFAMLVGVGAELSARSSRPVRAWRSALVRGAVLLGIGVWLATLPSQILIVLVWLGVLTWVMAGVCRLPDLAVLLVGLAGLASGPLFEQSTRAWWYTEGAASLGGLQEPWVRAFGAALDLVLINEDYRLVAFVGYACLGVLAVRRLRRRPLLPGLVALAAAAGVYALDKLGVASLDPYAGTWQETGFDAAFALAVLLLTLAAYDRLGSRLQPLALVGAMTLTLYVVQILATVAYLEAGPASGRDDSWPLLIGLTLASFGFAWLWHLALGRTRLRRGPIEGVVGLLTR